MQGAVPRRKSVSEMANEQLNGGQRRDRMAEGVNGAGKADCMAPGGSLLSVVPLAVAVATDKCKMPN